MAGTFQFYTDAALTTPQVGPLTFTEAFDGSTGAVDQVLYFGSAVSGRTLQNSTSPGTAQITMTPVDGAIGSGQGVGIFKLATTQGGLATATAGAALNLGTSVSGGVAGAKSVWIRCDITAAGGSTAIGSDANLSFVVSTVNET